jgi:DNA-binding Xre family transcriptional regulator
MTSYIYFIQAKGDGPIKIGTTGHDPRKRMVKIQSDCPWPVKLIGAISGTAAQEKQIHLVLSRFRTQGEWFDPHPIVLAAVSEALRYGEALAIETKAAKHTHALSEYRTQKKLSLRDLGKITGLSAATISRFETGRKRPSANALARICGATGISGASLRPDWAVIFATDAAQ